MEFSFIIQEIEGSVCFSK